MTNEELKELVASLAIAQRETDKQIKELRDSQKETDRQFKETDRRLKELAKGVCVAQRETDKQLGKSANGRSMAQEELRIAQKETDRQIKELGKQIGGLANKFGSFTEGMALPSMEKILQEQFGMTIIAPNFKVKRNGKFLEMDVFAYSNGEQKTACIVEVKSHLREESLEQILDILKNFPKFLPDHADKKLYGILAAVNIPENIKDKVLKSGIYVARISDEHFKLQVPKNFQAKNFQMIH